MLTLPKVECAPLAGGEATQLVLVLQAILVIATHPGLRRLARHPVTSRDLDNGNTTGADLHDGVIMLWWAP